MKDVVTLTEGERCMSDVGQIRKPAVKPHMDRGRGAPKDTQQIFVTLERDDHNTIEEVREEWGWLRADYMRHAVFNHHVLGGLLHDLDRKTIYAAIKLLLTLDKIVESYDDVLASRSDDPGLSPESVRKAQKETPLDSLIRDLHTRNPKLAEMADWFKGGDD